ncbi:MAG: RNA polymerase subunit sigma [Ponticaulis sp.]|nr:RNA polymerase subunit sigma [Ponticaulis sp.]|tara:strand:+ start:7035 stop:7592 length:558 start_codon:yes stop_codon:yes gene_type:complete
MTEREKFSRALEAIAEKQCRESFTELFGFFAPRIKSYLMRLGSDDVQAEELAQEVMITVWRKAGQFDPKQASPSTWIFRIARNRRIDAFRRTKNLDVEADEPALSPAPLPQPQEQMELIETEEIVRDAVSELPDDQRKLLKAAFFDGLSHVEIATRFKLPLGTVKSRIRLAFQKLRTKLDYEEGE